MLVRFSEFARAVVSRSLANTSPVVRYFGFTFTDFALNTADLRTQVYNAWDTKPAVSPPKSRPGSGDAAQQAGPALEILAWSNGAPRCPAALLARFADGTEEKDIIMKAKKDLELQFPASKQPAPAEGRTARVGGVCDYTLNENKQPLDLTRMIELPPVRVDDFQIPRWADSFSCF